MGKRRAGTWLRGFRVRAWEAVRDFPGKRKHGPRRWQEPNLDGAMFQAAPTALKPLPTNPAPSTMEPEPSYTPGDPMESGSVASLFSNSEQQLLGNRRPPPHKLWKQRSMKLIVVGDSGIGKSTLIKALLSTPQERLAASGGLHDKFKRDPKSLCTSVTWKDEEDRTAWTYVLQDTPGFGHLQDPDEGLAAILHFLESQNHARLAMEQSRARQLDMQEVEDPRLALCLYCIGPHRLRPIDLKFMYEIGQHVPVVPIVTKADTMTVREAQVHRALVLEKIANPMVPGVSGPINIFQFSQEALRRAGISDICEARPPFLVISSDDLNEPRLNGPVPVYWPQRSYPWGVAEAFNRGHSDLLSLRSLLFKEAVEDIQRSMRQQYETWRRKQLGRAWVRRTLLQVLGWLAIPAATYRLGVFAARQRRQPR